jgi:hypothetical protein
MNNIISIIDIMDSNKRKKLLRAILLKKLINQILSGEFDNTTDLPDELFNNQLHPRQKYISTKDRSSYNYGYMTSSEFGAGSPNTWV